MNPRHIAFLISNGYGPDVRVQKEAHTLAAAGYRVTIIAWDRECKFPAHELEDAPGALKAALRSWPGRVSGDWPPVAVTRIQIPAGYRTGRRLLIQIPRYWQGALHELRRAQPDVVHAHDLDTLPAAWWYGAMARVPVVYDAREYYPGMVRANVGRSISAALETLEQALAPRATAVLTVGTRLEARLTAMGAKVTVIPNTQGLYDQDWVDQARWSVRGELSVPDGALLTVYIGQLTPDRLLSPVLDAVPRLPDVWLAVGGTGPRAEEVRGAAESCERVRVLGQVELARVAAFVAASDVVYYGLNASDPNAYYFMPNLAFFALAIGRPLMVTPVGEIAEFVRRKRCGVVMEAATGAAALDALRLLSEDGFRSGLAQRARSLGEGRYNWTHTASDLLGVYECLFNVKNCI